MGDVWIYADETGDLDMSGAPGTSNYFGFGTATFVGEHAAEMWAGHELRCVLESVGVQLQKGFHAKDDSHSTRTEVFDLLHEQRPRLDSTFLLKERAYPYIKAAGNLRLYKMAWFLHFKHVVMKVSQPRDTIYVVAATLSTNKKLGSARAALQDVCQQYARDRAVVLCNWDAASTWGIQLADYGLWATQRVLEGRSCSWFEKQVEPHLATQFAPWGKK